MITGWRSFFFYLFVLAIVGLSWGLGLDVDLAFLIVGSVTVLLIAWLFFGEKPAALPLSAHGEAKLASSDDVKKSGLSRDL
jgi:hypothetical protein